MSQALVSLFRSVIGAQAKVSAPKSTAVQALRVADLGKVVGGADVSSPNGSW